MVSSRADKDDFFVWTPRKTIVELFEAKHVLERLILFRLYFLFKSVFQTNFMFLPA